MDIQVFLSTQKTLLNIEHSAETQESSDLIENSDSQVLEKIGIALLSLKYRSTKFGLYGRNILTFTRSSYNPESKKKELDEEARKRMQLEKNKLSIADNVGIFLSTKKMSGKPLLSGLIHRITLFKISIALEKENAADLESAENLLSIKFVNIVLLSNEVTHLRHMKALERVEKVLTNEQNHPSYILLKHVLFTDDELPDFFHNPSIKKKVDFPSFLKTSSQTKESPNANIINDSIDMENLNFAFSDPSLNNEQRLSILKALQNQSVFLIHGPPGTGKTKTLCEIIYQSVKLKKLKILACGPSNISVDNMVERLATKVKVCRIGNPVRVLKSIQEFTIDSLILKNPNYKLIKEKKREKKNLLEKLRKKKEDRKEIYINVRAVEREIKELERMAVKEVVEEADVVLCTNTMADDKIFRKCLKDKVFDLLVIDEAAQALEVSCYIPILLSKQVILGGDHKQLPPTIKSREAEQKGLSITLFDRMMSKVAKKQHYSQLLRTQYRMNEKIMNWSSKEVYNGLLLAAENVKERCLEKDFPILMLMDTFGCGMGETTLKDEDNPKLSSHSKYNIGEADLLLQILTSILPFAQPSEIGIISPYNAQTDFIKNLIIEKLPNTISPFIEVSSVDGFQGREKDAILISMVRSNEKKEIGFLSEYRRMNVAVTRARKFVGIVGDCETLKSDQFLSKMLEYFKNFGEYRSGMEFWGSEEVRFNNGNGGGQLAKKSEKKDQNVEKGEKTKKVKGKNKNKNNNKNHQPVLTEGNENNNASPLNEKKSEANFDEANAKFLEKFKKKLEKFIKNPNEQVLEESNLNSYQRMKLHELAQAYNLIHKSEGEGPDRKLIIIKPQDEELKEEQDEKQEKIQGIEITKNSDEILKNEKVSNPNEKIKNSGAAKKIDNDINQIENLKEKKKKKEELKKKKEEKKEVDDFEFMDQMILLNTTCNFYDANKIKCEKNPKIMGIDCLYCNKRYCNMHGLPEKHGCGFWAAQHEYANNKIKTLEKIRGLDQNRCKMNEKQELKKKVEEVIMEKQKERGKKKEEKKK